MNFTFRLGSYPPNNLIICAGVPPLLPNLKSETLVVLIILDKGYSAVYIGDIILSADSIGAYDFLSPLL